MNFVAECYEFSSEVLRDGVQGTELFAMVLIAEKLGICSKVPFQSFLNCYTV